MTGQDVIDSFKPPGGRAAIPWSAAVAAVGIMLGVLGSRVAQGRIDGSIASRVDRNEQDIKDIAVKFDGLQKSIQSDIRSIDKSLGRIQEALKIRDE